ncbi:MAG: S8/S53 family peptidase [Actinobacteria bacterium]|nr:S8/S53 family peptidase [Actinomycetota bacterium]
MESIPPGSTLSDGSGHATFVAGLILQQAPAATVHVRQVLGAGDSCDSVTLHDAILDLAEHPIDILNLSLGCTTADDRAPFAIRRALRRFRAERPGAIVVAAGGNHPNGHRFWPAALPDVLGVTPAAPSPDGGWEEAAGYPAGPWVDVTAPGRRVASTFLFGDYLRPDSGGKVSFAGWGVGSGSSFACAVATGYLARMWTPNCRVGDLLATARHAGAPTTTGGRLVLGVDRVLH